MQETLRPIFVGNAEYNAVRGMYDPTAPDISERVVEQIEADESVTYMLMRGVEELYPIKVIKGWSRTPDDDLEEALTKIDVDASKIAHVWAQVPGHAGGEDWHWIVQFDTNYAYVTGGCEISGWCCTGDVEIHYTDSIEEAIFKAPHQEGERCIQHCLSHQCAGRSAYALTWKLRSKDQAQYPEVTFWTKADEDETPTLVPYRGMDGSLFIVERGLSDGVVYQRCFHRNDGEILRKSLSARQPDGRLERSITTSKKSKILHVYSDVPADDRNFHLYLTTQGNYVFVEVLVGEKIGEYFESNDLREVVGRIPIQFGDILLRESIAQQVNCVIHYATKINNRGNNVR